MKIKQAASSGELQYTSHVHNSLMKQKKMRQMNKMHTQSQVFASDFIKRNPNTTGDSSSVEYKGGREDEGQGSERDKKQLLSTNETIAGIIDFNLVCKWSYGCVGSSYGMFSYDIKDGSNVICMVFIRNYVNIEINKNIKEIFRLILYR